MAYELTNNRRENIILKIIEILEDIEGIVTVKRAIPSVTEWISMPESLCPYIGVVANVQRPAQDRYVKPAAYLQCVLPVKIWFFGYDNDIPDSGISYWCETILKAIFADSTLSGLAEGISITPESDTNTRHPNFVFMLEINVLFLQPKL